MATEKNGQQTGFEQPKTIRMNFGGKEIEAIVNDDGSVTMPEEVQSIMTAGMAIMNKAEEGISNEIKPESINLKDGGNTNVADNFKGLPMRELIGGPLFAAAEAQEKLASIALDYYQKIAYETGDKGEPKLDETRLLNFKLERPVIQGGVASTQQIEVKAPFIGLVPIPSLLVDRIDVDFQMEVTETNQTTDNTNTEVSTNVSSKWFGVNVGISGKVSSSRENTRSTNQTAKYQVHVTASQQPQTEGLSKLMDVMAACIEPIQTDGGK